MSLITYNDNDDDIGTKMTRYDIFQKEKKKLNVEVKYIFEKT